MVDIIDVYKSLNVSIVTLIKKSINVKIRF